MTSSAESRWVTLQRGVICWLLKLCYLMAELIQIDKIIMAKHH